MNEVQVMMDFSVHLTSILSNYTAYCVSIRANIERHPVQLALDDT